MSLDEHRVWERWLGDVDMARLAGDAKLGQEGRRSPSPGPAGPAQSLPLGDPVPPITCYTPLVDNTLTDATAQGKWPLPSGRARSHGVTVAQAASGGVRSSGCHVWADFPARSSGLENL